jgi:hypothetical protein
VSSRVSLAVPVNEVEDLVAVEGAFVLADDDRVEAAVRIGERGQ